MSYTKLRSYSTNAIGELLPVDKETCLEMVTYALNLPSDYDIQSHFLNLLGENDASFAFISKFIELKHEEDIAVEKSKKKTANKPSYIPTQNKPTSIPTQNKQSKSTNAWQAPAPATKPATNRGRLDSKKSTQVSELIDLKPSNQLSSSQAKKSKKKNVDNLKDIESALLDLEVSSLDLDLEGSDYVKRVCNCMATRHPLFEVAPNCLNCGKIICSKEGLQPCSFCGKPLLSTKDKLEIISILKAEKDSLETKQKNIKNKSIQQQETPLGPKPKPKKIVFSSNVGENLWQAQEKALKQAEAERKKMQQKIEQEETEKKDLEAQIEEMKRFERVRDINPDLLQAQERLETLLNFQETGAERTKIIDRASDFEMPSSNSGSSWLSPLERALHMKKQQKQLRKYEEEEKTRAGRGKKVVEMVIKNGKVQMVERTIVTHKEEDESEIRQLESSLKESKISKESELAKNIWDYESDKNRWEKPVYVSSNATNQDVIDVPIKQRVQIGDSRNDETDLVISLPS